MKKGFNKLKKAIKRNDKIAMYQAIITMDTRPDKAKTYGESVEYEVKRALRHLGIDRVPDTLNKVLGVIKSRATDIWDEEIVPLKTSLVDSQDQVTSTNT